MSRARAVLGPHCSLGGCSHEVREGPPSAGRVGACRRRSPNCTVPAPPDRSFWLPRSAQRLLPGVSGARSGFPHRPCEPRGSQPLPSARTCSRTSSPTPSHVCRAASSHSSSSCASNKFANDGSFLQQFLKLQKAQTHTGERCPGLGATPPVPAAPRNKGAVPWPPRTSRCSGHRAEARLEAEGEQVSVCWWPLEFSQCWQRAQGTLGCPVAPDTEGRTHRVPKNV